MTNNDKSKAIILIEKLRLIESELYRLSSQYGVKTVKKLDELIEKGKLTEEEVGEDIFRFDYLVSEKKIIRKGAQKIINTKTTCMAKFTTIARIAEVEFSDIVLSTHDFGHKLRIYLNDKSFIDVFSTSELGLQKFSIHWERTHIDETIYRIDNTPDKKWSKIKSFPIHFHHRKYSTVT